MNISRRKPTFFIYCRYPIKGEVHPMLVSKAYKFHIYLNKNQEILIAKTIGCNRFVFKT
ncbi:hypothetical protein EXW32_28945 (plasmid) [Bacillus mycoides]|nr:hypothetical protein EXW32_28945 [Bacillus mycoides]